MSNDFWTQVAESIPYDNSDGTYDDNPENIKEALDENSERGQQALDTPRYTLSLQHNGNVSDGTFFGYSNLLPGDATPVIVPVDSEFIEFTFSNSRTNADYTLYFRKNGTGATAFHTSTKTNTQFYTEVVTPESFNAGDQIYVEYQDDGQNASDAAVVLLFKAVP